MKAIGELKCMWRGLNTIGESVSVDRRTIKKKKKKHHKKDELRTNENFSHVAPKMTRQGHF